MNKPRLKIAVLLASVIAASTIGAFASKTTQVDGEWLVGGMDIALEQQLMNNNFNWLISEQAQIQGASFVANITDEDRRQMGELPCDYCNNGLERVPMRVGVVKSIQDLEVNGFTLDAIVQGQSVAGGALRQLQDGFTWTAMIESPSASALRLQLSGIQLPAQSELWVYGREGEAYGPFGPNDMDEDAEFWTPSVSGDQLYVQLRYFGAIKAGDIAKIGFGLTAVGHVGSRGININQDPLGNEDPAPDAFCSFNASCVENASCGGLSNAVADAQYAVAHMQWISGAFINICTGGLLADTDNSSQRPLFLTANHCLSRGKDAKNLETFWQFTTSCNGSCPQQYQDPPGVAKLVGSSVLSTGSTGDFTLLELNSTPPSGSRFMGWNNSPIANSNNASLYRIHHPGGAPQSYSEHSVDTSAGTCQGVPRGSWIYSRDTYGAQEGGSSGSPVVNSAGEVVGQLTGSCGTNTGNVCDANNNATIDGALAAYYSSVEQFLDPQGGSGGGCDNDGVCDPGEDCNNCGDCEGRTGGRPSNRFCCGDGTAQSAEGNGDICDGNY